MRKSRLGILIGGLIAGTFDITYAIVFSSFHGVSAMRVLQSVASGLLGSKAYDGGISTALLGLLLHFFIAFSWATIFYILSQKIPLITDHPVIAGLLYGAMIYLIMYLIVLPASAYPNKINFALDRIAINLAVHMFLIGLPISLAISRTRIKVR